MSTVPPVLNDSSLPTSGASQVAVGSIWRRLVALIVDALIVGIAGNLIAFPFFDTFSRLGMWGRLVGFCLAFPYFVLLNSGMAGGQTLGKKWLGLRVVNKDGEGLSLGRATVRYVVLATPFFLNGIVFPITRTPWIVSFLLSSLVFGVSGATLYLVLFNTKTRQGLHDLATGSYVVQADKRGTLELPAMWKMHWVIVGSLLVIVCIGAGILGNKLKAWGPFPALLDDVRMVEAIDGVRNAGVQDLTWNSFGDGKRQTIFVVNIFWNGTEAEQKRFANNVAIMLLKHDPKVQNHDILRVVLIRGYDLGIAHGEISHGFDHTPSEWAAGVRD